MLHTLALDIVKCRLVRSQHPVHLTITNARKNISESVSQRGVGINHFHQRSKLEPLGRCVSIQCAIKELRVLYTKHCSLKKAHILLHIRYFKENVNGPFALWTCTKWVFALQLQMSQLHMNLSVPVVAELPDRPLFLFVFFIISASSGFSLLWQSQSWVFSRNEIHWYFPRNVIWVSCVEVHTN